MRRLEWRFGVLLALAIVPALFVTVYYEIQKEWTQRHVKAAGLPKEKR